MAVKKGWIISAAVLLILIVAAWVLSGRADDFLGKKLTEYIERASSGKYQIAWSQLDVSLFSSTVKAADVRFYSADGTFLKLQDSLMLQPELRVKSIRISGIALISFLFSDKLEISSLQLHEPAISLQFHPPSDTLSFVSWQAADSNGMAVLLRELAIVEGSLSWSNENGRVLETGYDILATDLSNTTDEGKLPAKVTSAEVKLRKTTFFTGNKLMAIGVDSSRFEFSSGEAELSGISLYSLYDKYELSQVVQHEIDWVSVEISKIAFQLIEPAKAIRDERFHIPAVVIDGLTGLIFKDKRWPFPDRPDKPMPHQMVEKIPFKLIIDSVLIRNSSIVYEEHVEKANEPGHVAFRELEAKLKPLRTDTSMMARLDASAMVMGEGKLEARFDIPLQAGAGRYNASGTLGKMQMRNVNAILHHSAGVSIESGQVDQLDFNFSYDEKQSEGNVQFAYSDLKVQLLDRQDDGAFSNLKEDVGSWLVNAFVAKTDNTPGDKFREGLISMERNPKKSIFNYWWKSLFSGLRSSITPGEKEKE